MSLVPRIVDVGQRHLSIANTSLSERAKLIASVFAFGDSNKSSSVLAKGWSFGSLGEINFWHHLSGFKK